MMKMLWIAALIFAALLSCTEGYSCCPFDRYGLPCCAQFNGVCCYDGTCCPSGMKCASHLGANLCCWDYSCRGVIFQLRTVNSATCPSYTQYPVGPHQCQACCSLWTHVCCKDKCILESVKTPCSSSELSRSYPVSAASLDATFQWLLCTEGFNVSGYCPTTGSGLTVGAGVDFGQQNSAKAFSNVGTPQCLYPRIVSFYGAACSDQCFNPAYSTAIKLCLTAQEAAVLSKGFLADTLNKINPYALHVDDNTFSSLASIRHWAGSLGQSCPAKFTSAYKLCVPNSSGHLENLLWSAIKDKTGTTSTVEAAVSATLDQYKKLGYSTGISRFTKELAHIQGKMPCHLSIDEAVCNRQICTTCDLND